MGEVNHALLLGGIGLAGYALYQLAQPPAQPKLPGGLTCPPGQHLAGGTCVADALPTPDPRPVPAAGYRVLATAGVIVRAGPGTGYQSRGALPYQTIVSIDCQTQGERVGGSTVWDRITGPIAGYVSDWWISTPNVGAYSPGLGVCPGGINPPTPPPGTLPPTGGQAALNSPTQLSPSMIVSTGCGASDADYIVVRRTAFATASPMWGRVWIRDAFTWSGLAVPRSAIWVITPGLLYQMADAGTVYRQMIRRGGLRWVWTGGDCRQCYTLLPGLDPGPAIFIDGANTQAPTVLRAPAGYC